jgi:hypothetical protein
MDATQQGSVHRTHGDTLFLDTRIKVQLVPMADIYLHEDHDDTRVERLRWTIEQDRLQRHPIILGHIDDRFLLHLDGATRIKALQQLKCRHIAAQIVNYADDAAISLCTWAHVTRLDYSALQRITRSLPACSIEKLGDQSVVEALASGRFLATVTFSEGRVLGLAYEGPSSHKLELLKALSVSYGILPIREIPTDTSARAAVQALFERHPSGNVVVSFGPFTKQDVIEAVLMGSRFPAGITRHIIHCGRILYLNAPLSLLQSALGTEEKNRKFEGMLSTRQQRFYQEPTIQFEN